MQQLLKICIVITHPSQFDVPVFRLGIKMIDVIFTDSARCLKIYDKEIQREVEWEADNKQGYNYTVLPSKTHFLALFKKISKGNYDLVLTSGYSSFLYALSIILGKFFAKKNAIRVDTVLFNNTKTLKLFFKKCLFSILRVFVTDFFSVGKLSTAYLKSVGVSEKHIYFFGYISNNNFFKKRIIANEREETNFRRLFQLPEDKKIILCVSKHNAREAPFDTLKAFSKLKDRNLHLVLVGDGDLHNQLKEFAKSLNILNITFTGYVDFQLLPSFYSIAAIFIHDSKNEPWGVSVQEALSCGVPVICSDKVGAAFDLIIEGKNGYIYGSDDSEKLQKLIPLALLLPNSLFQSITNEILKQWEYEKVIKELIKCSNS